MIVLNSMLTVHFLCHRVLLQMYLFCWNQTYFFSWIIYFVQNDGIRSIWNIFHRRMCPRMDPCPKEEARWNSGFVCSRTGFVYFWVDRWNRSDICYDTIMIWCANITGNIILNCHLTLHNNLCTTDRCCGRTVSNSVWQREGIAIIGRCRTRSWWRLYILLSTCRWTNMTFLISL